LAEGENAEKIYSMVKLALVVLILFLKNPNEYSDIVSDLYQVTNLDKDWVKVYTDIVISLFHQGNNTLSDYTMNTFKKISKHMTKDSFDVLLTFINSDEKGNVEFEQEEEEEGDDDMQDDDTAKNMFEDLVEESVDMLDI